MVKGKIETLLPARIQSDALLEFIFFILSNFISTGQHASCLAYFEKNDDVLINDLVVVI